MTYLTGICARRGIIYCTIATSLIHSKLDYCNSLFLNISNQQLNRLQLVFNSAARAVTKTPKFHHITPHLKSLHWLKITQRIQYKILSLTYKSLQYNKPSSISDLLTIQPTRSTRSSAVVTLQRPSNPSRLKISDRSFYFQAPVLWNALPHHLRSHSSESELSTGWMDPWVGSGRVGSRFCRILAGRVGTGQHFGFISFLLIISCYLNRYESSNTTFGLIYFHRYTIYNNYLIIK